MRISFWQALTGKNKTDPHHYLQLAAPSHHLVPPGGVTIKAPYLDIKIRS